MKTRPMIDSVLPFLGFNSSETEDYKFIGSAFLHHCNLLITAGHNIEKEKNKEFKKFGTIYNNNVFVLNELIFFEHEDKFIISGEKKDLAIYRFESAFIDTIDFYPFDLDRLDEVIIIGYRNHPLGDNKPENHNSMVTYPKYSYKNFPAPNFEAYYTKYLNCFGVSKKLEPGFSGCPIFRNGSICGMVSYGFQEKVLGASQPKDLETTAIKSTYISKIVSNLKIDN